MKANSMSDEDGEQEARIAPQDDLPPQLSQSNANQSTGPREKSRQNTDHSGSIDAPVLSLRLSQDGNKSGEIRLARPSGSATAAIDDENENDAANLLSNSPKGPQMQNVAPGLAVAPGDQLFMTIDKVREFESLGGASGLYNNNGNDMSSQGLGHLSTTSANVAQKINKQMQAISLETEQFQSQSNAASLDNNMLKMVTLDRQGPSADNALNFETSTKNIFESSVDQRVQPEISPQDIVSDLTSNLNLMQTVASSGLSLGQSAQEKYHEQQKKSFCSLFVIFGLNATEFVHNNFKEQYDVLGSYPNLEQHPEVAADHKFVQDLRMICFPELSLKTERFKMSNMDPLCRCAFFHFISTNDMGDKKYLTSVHFKEILLSERGAFVIDKAICVASSQPIFSLQKQVLHQIFQKVVLQNNNVSIKAFKQAQWTYDGFLDEYEQPPPHDFPNFVYKFMMDQVMCAENRKIRDRGDSGGSRSPSPRGAKKTNAKSTALSLPAVDFTANMELYIAIFSKHLYFDPTVERDIHIIQTDTAPATASNAAGYSSNQSMFGTGTNFTTNQQQNADQKANRHVPLFKFRNMKPFGFQLENYPFDLLLQTLKPDKLIQLVTALLLERKIVLIKREIGDIALIMQSLITLLSPFQWHFTIITYLTRELVDMLDAPFPFMIGVSWATWDSICLTKDYAEEIFIFDLESQERRYITKQEVPELPSPFGDDLLAGLKDVMDKKDRRLAALRAEYKHSKSKSLSKRQLDQQFDEQYWADAQLSVKQLFFNFLLMTVNNYIRFYRTNEEQKARDKENDKSEWKVKSSEDFFDFQGYIEWQDDKQMERTGENNLFMREFVKTQAFHEFIEQNSSNVENEGAENAAVFFESCIELLNMNDCPIKKLKAAQQEMIDQAKYNLATPVKFKFNGIYSKYVEGLRKREFQRRNNLDGLSPEECKERKFSDLSEADQVDDIIMKYIFMRPESPNSFRQYSLIADVNQDMVLKEIPRIRYDLVELYWQKMYKTKSGGPGAGGKQSNRSIENPPQAMHVNKPSNMQKRKKRLSNKNEIEYEEYINGNQALQADQFSDTGSQHSNLKNFIKKHNHQLKKNRSGNIIHDFPESSRSQAGSAMNHNIADYTQQTAAFEYQNVTELKSKKTERQAQSTRNFVSLSQQKVQQRTSYNVKSYHQYTTNKAQNEQLRIVGLTGKAKKSQDSFQEGFASLQGQHLRQTKSPKVGGSILAKSTTVSITRMAAAHTLLQSGKGSGLLSHRKLANMHGGSSKPSPNQAALTAIKSTRNKSQQSAALLKQQQQHQQATTRSSRKQSASGSSKPAAANFQEKVRVARQRGSIQYIYPEISPPLQHSSSETIPTTQEPSSRPTTNQDIIQQQLHQHQVEIIERYEYDQYAGSNNVIEDQNKRISGGMFQSEEPSMAQRQMQLADMQQHKMSVNVSARQISPNPQQPLFDSTGTKKRALGKSNTLTSSVQSLGGQNDKASGNKPVERHQSFLVKGGKQSAALPRNKSKNEALKRLKTGQSTLMPSQSQAASGSGTSRQKKLIHPAFNTGGISGNNLAIPKDSKSSQAATPQNREVVGGLSLDTILPGRKSLKSKRKNFDPSIELVDPSSSNTGNDQSNSMSTMVMPEYTEKKAVTNTNAASQKSMTQLAHSISAQSNRLNQMGARNHRTGQMGAGTLSKVLRISYELPQAKDSFINIEKEEEECMDDFDHMNPQKQDSSLIKEADKTELQDFTKQPASMVARQEQIQGGGFTTAVIHQQIQQSDSPDSHNDGASSSLILEVDQPDHHTVQQPDRMLPPASSAGGKTEDVKDDEYDTVERKDEFFNMYNSTDGVGDGVNEMVEDEADMAQKTAYYLQYRSKFNKINSDSQVKIQASGSTAGPVRQQMMPSNSSQNSAIAAVVQRENSGKIASQQSINNLRSDHSGSSASHGHLLMQMSGSSNDTKLSTLLQGSKIPNQQVQQQSEKQSVRKGPSMPLSMLLTKTNSRPAKRQPGGTSKTRSIQDKQFSFQEIARMPSQSLIQHQQQQSMAPRMQSGNNLDAPPSMHGVLPKSSQQQEMTIPMPRSSNDNHFHRNAEFDDVRSGNDDDDEGWFTPIESKRLSQRFPNRPLVSDETKQKLQRFYSDIDGSFMEVHNQHTLNQQNLNATNSISRQQQQLFKKPTQMQPPQQLIDSPQQSSRKSSSTGKHPPSNISRTALLENKVLANEEVAMMSPSQDNSGNNNMVAAATPLTGSVIIDNSIAAPNNGILFSHQKRRTERYRDDL